MSTIQAPPSTQNARQGQRPQQGVFQRFWEIAQQTLLVWVAIQIVTGFITKLKDPTPVPSEESSPVNPFLLPPATVELAWPLGQPVSMHVQLTAEPSDQQLGSVRAHQIGNLPSFSWKNIMFGDWNEERVAHLDVEIPEIVRKNGTLWADIFLVKSGSTLDPSQPNFDSHSIQHIRKLLTPYIKKTKIRKEKNLISGGESMDVEEDTGNVILPHWNQNLTLALVSESVMISYAQLNPIISDHIRLIPDERDETGTKGYYKPIIFPNEFWHIRSQYTEINETTRSLPLHVKFQPMSFFKFQVFVSMTHGFNEAAQKQGGAAAGEIEEVKRMLMETNPWFLGVTALVGVLHMVFELLAFKSDVSHWRQKRELVGVSVRTIITNVIVQLVILLYLIDNNTETSWMILFGSGIGVVIEAWKITKVVDIRVISASPGSLLPYKLDIKDKHVLSDDEKKTQEYDKLAFRYVSYVAIPLLAAYTIYSLVYHTYRGWYSFVISTLTSFVYMFGFAQLVPQLIINYKLKSVAHMPMKAMIYKTLSTVVDDFFAFCIKMPFLHRLACFRDDVVFLIFLYQRWIYRVDPKRVNEYGQVLVEEADEDGESKKSK